MPYNLSRRDMLKTAALGAIGLGFRGLMPSIAQAMATSKTKKKHCILLWMTGGASQLDTFDMKPDHENGGDFSPISTNVTGLQISEHLPKLAKMGDQLAVIRSLSTKEGDHSRGTYLMRTGHRPGSPIQYPTIGSSISKELGSDELAIPHYISIAPYTVFSPKAFQPGFLGPQYSPLTVGSTVSFQQQRARQQSNDYAELGVDDLKLPTGVSKAQMQSRLVLLGGLQKQFVQQHQTASPVSHQTVYERAAKMLGSKAAEVFDLSQESDKTRERYGKDRFGQGCLMARRLIERGVSFVDVSLGGFGGVPGWDTHRRNFATVKTLSAELDAGWSTLMADLKQRGLLESTTIIWMGEFGRTPKINRGGGRDHYPKAWSAVLAGGGIKGGQAYGKTSKDGMEVVEGKVDVGDLLTTLCKATGINPEKQNISGIGRPINIAEGSVIDDVIA